jgi:hyperosmotically inducible protein
MVHAVARCRSRVNARQRTDALRRFEDDRPPNSLEGRSMKNELATVCLVLGTLVTPFAATAADADVDRKDPVAFVKDSVITTKVKAKLAAETARSLATIHVDTDAKGMVVMSGNARTQEDADKAVEIARATEGVTSVHSTITIKKDD